MRLAKVGKILLSLLRGADRRAAPADAGREAHRSTGRPEYQAEIKDWVHAQTGYHIGFAHVSPAFRWYGPELYFDRLELRSKDDQRVLARAAGGRVAADIWQLIGSGKLLAGRIEVDSPNIAVVRLGPTRFAVASEIELGGDDSSRGPLRIDDLPAGKLVIRHAVLTLQNWNSALPLLDPAGTSTSRCGAMARTSPSYLPRSCRRRSAVRRSFREMRAAAAICRTLSWNAVARGARQSRSRAGGGCCRSTWATCDAGNGAFDIAASRPRSGAVARRSGLHRNQRGYAADRRARSSNSTR